MILRFDQLRLIRTAQIWCPGWDLFTQQVLILGNLLILHLACCA